MTSERFKLADFEPLIREVIESGGEFTMKTHGISMKPMLSDGNDSVVLVSVPEEIKTGDVIFYKRDNGQYVLHRVVGKRKDGYVLRGDNQIINEYGVKKEAVIAIVKAYIKNSQRIETEDKEYRKYVSTLGVKYALKKAASFVKRVKDKLCRVMSLSGKNNDK
ncbi:MAG: S24/S26 family peptidase [Clostridia bacterium]|nr:S24/S26 family peptidase [Clostridia bacterium]